MGHLMASGSIGNALQTLRSNYFAPFMEIDPSTFRCSLTREKLYVTNTHDGLPFTSNPNMAVYINTSLYVLFPTFPYKLNSATGDMGNAL